MSVRSIGLAPDEKFRVAIADDNELMLEALQIFLARDVEVEVVAVARTGAEAVAVAERGGFDVLVLDMALPDFDGGEVLRQLQRRAPALHVVVCSAHADEKTRLSALEGGADAFVVKDRILEELPAAIRRAANASRDG
jgi:DNA-binding NarL/FixJ family response regulator